MTFQDLGLNQLILDAINEKGYKELTKVQSRAIPAILQGNDLLMCAHTGSGKTAAFALPIIEKIYKYILTNESCNDIKALILVPTRELAIQIGENFESYTKNIDIKIGVIFGGITPKRHIKVLKKEPNILIATPGRLLDLIGKGYANLSKVDNFVLDEADQMLDSKTREDVHMIIDKLAIKRQNILLSATMPKGVLKLTNSILLDPVKIDDKDSCDMNISTADIEQKVYFVEESEKLDLLLKIIKSLSFELIMIYTRTKKKADQVCKAINIANIRSKAIHGDKSQTERLKSLELFREKKVKVLIATDVAARGIDIKGISYVINMNIPSVAETYIHRIGRTARAGESGVSISLCSNDEKIYLENIEKIQGQINSYDSFD